MPIPPASRINKQTHFVHFSSKRKSKGGKKKKKLCTHMHPGMRNEGQKLFDMHKKILVYINMHNPFAHRLCILKKASNSDT
jgi:hypothetical protein